MENSLMWKILQCIVMIKVKENLQMYRMIAKNLIQIMNQMLQILYMGLLKNKEKKTHLIRIRRINFTINLVIKKRTKVM